MLETIANINHPSRWLICGKSGSGKTHLAIFLILHIFSKLVDRIIIVCPTYYTQDAFRCLDDLINLDRDVFENVTPETFSLIFRQLLAQARIAKRKRIKNGKTLLFIDDCGSDNSIHGGRISSFGKISIQLRHLNVSSIVIVQNPKLASPNYRENADRFVFFPSHRYEEKTWINNEYNGTMAGKQLFLKLIQSAWNGVCEDEEEEGKHFLYIHIPPRGKIRYYSDFDKELTIDKIK